MSREPPPAEGWLVLSVQAPPPGEGVLLVEALLRVGARAVEREGERYVALLPPPTDVGALLEEAALAIRASTSIREPWLSWRWRAREEWAEEWTRSLEPRRVGRRIVVAPRERAPRSAEGDVTIRLVPGPGFGTAEHPTTRSCLRIIEERISPGDRVADVGTGSGVLAVAAAMLGAGRVLALEVDPHAARGARENVAENGVGERVQVREVEVGPDTLEREGAFDGIVANLRADVVLVLLPGLSRAMARAGWMVLSGILPPEAPEVLAAAEAVGLGAEEVLLEEGWWTGCFAPREESVASP